MLSGSDKVNQQQIEISGIRVQKDHRFELMLDWLKFFSPGNVLSVEYASGDASFRRYFRIALADRNLIVMDAPPEVENIHSFIRVCKLLDVAGVNVPEIIEVNESQGFLLLGDLGSTCYLSRLDTDTAPSLYRDAMDVLLLFHTNIDFEKCGLPFYDRDLVNKELCLFEEWFLNGKLGIRLTDTELHRLNQVKTLLVDTMLDQPKAVVHRDFHSRNLMVLDQRNPGVLDFQDAVKGPLTYDLVSLLRDCYIAWPDSLVDRWVEEYYSNLNLPGLSLEQFIRWFDMTGLQRHLKAVGIFSRLELRDNKPGYIADIPRTLNYIRAISAKYCELSFLGSFLETRVTDQLAGEFNR